MLTSQLAIAASATDQADADMDGIYDIDECVMLRHLQRFQIYDWRHPSWRLRLRRQPA